VYLLASFQRMAGGKIFVGESLVTNLIKHGFFGVGVQDSHIYKGFLSKIK
jgi:hypothetical protein